MNLKTFKITMDSILGGESRSSILSDSNQFQDSFAIDPDMNLDSNFSYGDNLNSGIKQKPSGMLVPVKVYASSETLYGVPHWIIPTPVSAFTCYIYDSVGSVYSIVTGLRTITQLGDLNDGGTASGNGAEYYDNYMYFARDTTIARYGPLNGSPSFIDDYWSTTLGMTPLSNETYPEGYYNLSSTPNHIMKRHSNGELFFGDVIGNQGVLHRIKTTKTTVEGDTDDGSKYNALDFPYKNWVTAIESYGDEIVVGLLDGVGGKAKIAFWDTVSTTYNRIIDFQFPDKYITKIINLGGVLYFFSGSIPQQNPMRITRYIGGSSFQEIEYLRDTYLPPPGSFSQDLNRIYFGSNFVPIKEKTPQEGTYGRPCVKALGSSLGGQFKLFSVVGTDRSTAAIISSVLSSDSYNQLLIGWYATPMTTSAPDHGGISTKGVPGTYSDGRNEKNVFRTRVFNVGQPFKITKIRIPLAHSLIQEQAFSGSKSITPYVWVDSGSFVHTLTTINHASQLQAERTRTAVIKPTNLTGGNDFFMELEWDTDEALTVKLPITFEGEYLDD